MIPIKILQNPTDILQLLNTNVFFETATSMFLLYIFSLFQNNPSFFKNMISQFLGVLNRWKRRSKAKIVLISYIKQVVKYSFLRNSEMSNATKSLLWYIQKHDIPVSESQEIITDNEELYFRPVHENHLQLTDDIYCNIYQKEYREDKHKGQNVYMEYTIEVCGDSYDVLTFFLKKCLEDKKNDIDNVISYQKYFIFDGKDDDNFRNGLKFKEFEHRSLIKYEQHLNDNKYYIHNILEQFENEEWYLNRNKTRNCAFIFHGEPGCGKTQTQCAIFNRYDGKHTTDTGKHIQLRHIIMVPLDKIQTKESFHEILHGNYINDNLIPPNRRLIFFSESDTQNNFIAFLDRSLLCKNDVHSNSQTFHLMKEHMVDNMFKSLFNNQSQETLNNTFDPHDNHRTDLDSQKKNVIKVGPEHAFNSPLKKTCDMTLGDVLISLDGVQKREGTMLFFDTNNFKLWDKALLRHSRIDYIVEFKKCSQHIIKDILLFYFKISEDNKALYDFSKIKDNVWSYSDLDSVLIYCLIVRIHFKHKVM